MGDNMADLFDERLIWALGQKARVSGVKIWVNDEKKEVLKLFKENFDTRWKKALEKVEELYGSCDEKDNNYYPLAYEERDDCVYIGIGDLDLHYSDYYDSDIGTGAFLRTIDDVVKHRPELSWDGFMIYSSSDCRCGVCGDYCISSDKKNLENERNFAIAGELVSELYAAMDYYILNSINPQHKRIDGTREIENRVNQKYQVKISKVWNDYMCDIEDCTDFLTVIAFHKRFKDWIGEKILEHVYESIMANARECYEYCKETEPDYLDKIMSAISDAKK